MPDLPALGGVGLLRRRDVDDLDRVGLQGSHDGRPEEKTLDLVLQRTLGDDGHVDIDVFGVPHAAEEKPEVATAFQREESLVLALCDEGTKEDEMEHLDRLTRRRGHELRIRKLDIYVK